MSARSCCSRSCSLTATGSWCLRMATRSGWSASRNRCVRHRAPRRRFVAARHPLQLRLRARSQVRGRGTRPRRGPRHRVLRDRGAGRADRADPRRGGDAVPLPRTLRGAPTQATQGRPALRPSRLRQDADRQGGGQLLGQEGRRAVGQGRRRGQVVLLEHQGSRTPQQVRRRDRAPHSSGLPAGPREGQPWARR